MGLKCHRVGSVVNPYECRGVQRYGFFQKTRAEIGLPPSVVYRATTLRIRIIEQSFGIFLHLPSSLATPCLIIPCAPLAWFWRVNGKHLYWHGVGWAENEWRRESRGEYPCQPECQH